MSVPTELNRVLYIGSDNLWALRRTDTSGAPIVPTDAKAQIRSATNGDLWVECVITIDNVNGWLYIHVEEDATKDAVWTQRILGKWDLEAITDGVKYRWVYGDVVISQEVTLS